VGYSQGAGVMRVAAPKISAELQQKVVALVMFGDPGVKQKQKFPPGLESKLLDNCAVGDPVSQSTYLHIRTPLRTARLTLESFFL
jgi:precorrin-2 methylase